ncbi:MAG: sugar kinase [Enterococcus sp.]|nr:sugar kinase [Enterococcus sp.]
MKVGAFGEVMLRLTPPEYLLLEQTDSLRIWYTGTGVNLLANLAHFDLEATLLTAVPDNRLGDAALAKIRGLGIETNFIIKSGQHLGSYFAEMGYGLRPTEVTYQNRLNSAFSLTKKETYARSLFLADLDLLHICGICFSLTPQVAQTAIELAKEASERGKKVCFDFNFRSSLNKEPEKKQQLRMYYEALLPYCQVVFGSAYDLRTLLGYEKSDLVDEVLIQKFLKEYQIEWFAGTKREYEENQKWLKGYLITQSEVLETSKRPLTTLDRIGAGDAFAAGVILGYLESWSLNETVEFSVANAIFAHTIQGDYPLTTRAQIFRSLNQPEQDLVR